MLKELPRLIDVKRLAFQGSHMKGRVALAQMSRLIELLSDVNGYVEIDWLFALDDQQRPMIQGSVLGQLSLQCQACLQPMPWTVDAKVALIILKEGQTQDDLPDGYEALSLTDTPVSLIRLIEDELILALPIVASHAACPYNKYQISESDLENNKLQKNPFQILSSLKM